MFLLHFVYLIELLTKKSKKRYQKFEEFLFQKITIKNYTFSNSAKGHNPADNKPGILRGQGRLARVILCLANQK